MDQRELEERLEGRADVADLNATEAQTPEEVPSEETPAPVAETVSEPEPVAPDPVQDYLAKYDGDTDKALRAAVEAQSLIGRQGQELGSIRQQLESLTQALTPPPAQAEEPTQDEWSWADEIGMDPNWRQGAEWALQNKPQLYDRIINAASTIYPTEVNRFETALALHQQQQAMEQRLQPFLQPIIQQAQRQQFENAYNNVRATAPDLADITPQLLKTAERFPELLSVLQTGTPEAQQRVVELMYLATKGSNAAPLADAAGQAAAQAADGAAALRLNAAVGTTTNSAPAPAGDTDRLTPWRNDLREELGLAPIESE